MELSEHSLLYILTDFLKNSYLAIFLKDYPGKAIILIEKHHFLKCTDPQKLDQKSNDWRSVFLWLYTVMSLKRKL